MTQIYPHTKFRWTENLTSRFIQLRKDNGKLFTGRKYSAQAGWEYILRLMQREFPTIMADVQYRVLKKKWSNLLQQYKELKNPVQGDQNQADDVSWPFYNAIEEVVHGQVLRRRPTIVEYEESNEIEEEVDPHEFLCVSVTPKDEQISPPESPIDDEYKHLDDTPIQVEEFSRSRDTLKHEPSISVNCLTRLSRTENQSRVSQQQEQQQLHSIHGAVKRAKRARQTVVRRAEGNKKIKRNHFESNGQMTQSPTPDVQLLNKFNEFLEYTKQRDDENRIIMLRILAAVERMAEKFD